MNLESLTAGITVTNRAQLTRARTELAERIASLFGVERKAVRIPWGSFVLYSPEGVRLTRDAEDQATRIKVRPGNYTVAIAEDVARAFLAHPAIKA